jgi:hypothetical protein
MSRFAPLSAALLGGLLLLLPACQMNERMSGTAFGAGGGAVLGGVTAGTVGGALIGGVGGALVGYLVGDYLADQRERGCASPAPAPIQCTPTMPSSPRVGGARTVVPGTARARQAYTQGRSAASAPQARALFQEAVRLDPSYADAWNALGLNYLNAGEKENAVDAFQRALAADPGHYAAKQNLHWAETGIR